MVEAVTGRVTAMDDMARTTQYTPPERLSPDFQNQLPSFAVDVYAFGCLAYAVRHVPILPHNDIPERPWLDLHREPAIPWHSQ